MKKLKGLGNRAYNILFHTHTVAGILISFALFVIFYAGAFSLFRAEILQWENPELRQPLQTDLDMDGILAHVDEIYDFNYTEITNVNFPTEESPIVSVYGQHATSDSTNEFVRGSFNPMTREIQDLDEPKTTVAFTIYYLHYFRQIPAVGLYISGLVALFFLFASITGILVHWRNMLTKFYAFVKEGKWKRIWTNSHTVLGVIGLPFQIIYAVTGAFFGLLILVLLPVVFLKYDGDINKVYSKVIPFTAVEVNADAPPSDNLSLNELAAGILAEYPNHHILRAQLKNYGKEDAKVLFAIDDNKGIHSSGAIAINMKDGEVLEEFSQIPYKKTYAYSVIDYIFKLHFANFGGYYIKIIYFILALITCFMIISGVLIWRTARDNNQYTFKQRLFHHKVTKTYLAICLSMFPAFALIFIANKAVPMEMAGRASIVNTIFFLGWLGMTVLGLFWNKYSQQNRNYLIMGGVLSLMIPLANGLATAGWIWDMWNTYHWVAYVDLFWLFTGLTALYLAFFVLKVKPTSDKPEETGKKEEEEMVKKPIAKKVPKKLIRKPVLNIKPSEKGLNLGET